MTDKSYLSDALAAHMAGDENRANDLLTEGLNYYSRRLAKACTGISKRDLPMLTAALKTYYLCNLEQCGDAGRELVDGLMNASSAVCIHN